MQNKRSRYREMERYMTYTLLANLGIFILYLIAAGFGIIWLKIIMAIIAILVSGLCLGYLYITKELLRRRSLWMSVSAAAIVLCLLFSLVLNIPSPNPYKQDKPNSTEVIVDQDS